MTGDQGFAGAFRAFEQAGWSDEGVAQIYDDGFGSLTTQSVPAVLEAVKAGSGVKLLDVATGPGFVAARAAERGALVTAVDYSPAMIERARSHFPSIDFRLGDAEALPFADESHDAVTISFGLLHMEQPDRAIAEAFRVLRPGGRLAFTVWAMPEKAVVFGMVQAAVQTLGTMAVPLPAGPSFFRFSDPEECLRSLAVAGFVRGSVIEVPQFWEFDSADELTNVMQNGTVRSRGLLLAQGPDVLTRIRDYIRDAVKPYMQADGRLRLPQPCVLSSGVKPG